MIAIFTGVCLALSILLVFTTILARYESRTPSSRTTAVRNGRRRDENREKYHARHR
jgi:hypothetical protein